METLPNSFTLNYLELLSFMDCLEEAIKSSNRANIVRCCSNMMYSLSDLLEMTIPDGYNININ